MRKYRSHCEANTAFISGDIRFNEVFIVHGTKHYISDDSMKHGVPCYRKIEVGGISDNDRIQDMA